MTKGDAEVVAAVFVVTTIPKLVLLILTPAGYALYQSVVLVR